jgi:hypothetical protein
VEEAVIAWLVVACGPATVSGPVAVVDGEAGFWGLPFPMDGRERADGTADLSELGGADVPIVADLLEMLDGVAVGASRTAPIWLPFDRSLAGLTLPSVGETLSAGSAVWLMDVDPASPERGRRFPVEVAAVDGSMPWDPPHALALLPMQGAPLRPSTRYAAVVTTALGGGNPLPALSALPALPAAALAAWVETLVLLDQLGVEVAAATVFTTGDPTSPLRDHLDTLRAAGGWAVVSPPALIEEWPEHCVYEGRLRAPVLQQGAPPYLTEGGGFADDGAVQRYEEARVFVTLPRAPVGGALDALVFVRTGGGGDRPLLDRGVRGPDGLDVAGAGYARELARAGWAGVQVDGPLGGLRNPQGADEQFLIFNIGNPIALRDNLRQSALELAMLPELLDGLTVDGAACGAAGDVRLSAVALWGHSMGATIAPLVTALQPRLDTLVLSGAGGSWIHNVLYKRSPLEVRPIAAAMLGQDAGALDRWHPILGLLQWAGEAADPPVYAADGAVWRGGVHTLMVQGIVDTYILPPIANAASASLRLAPGGEALDVEVMPEHQGVVEAARLVGRSPVELPTRGNLDGWTGVVVQRTEDGVEDGHEVAYQDADVRRAVQHFLASRASGAPEVVVLP